MSSPPIPLGDIHSPRSFPLLRYLLKSQLPIDSFDEDNLFSHIKATAGQAKDPIIDESYEVFKEAMHIIQNDADEKLGRPSVTIVGAGVSGLCAAYELKRRGFRVHVLEASSRVGGRVITFRDPTFAPGLHAEGGAMRIPKDHFLLQEYIQNFNLKAFEFEMENKFIYLSGLPGGKKTLTYDEFNAKLAKKDPRDPDIKAIFPGLKDDEIGKTCDQLFDTAVTPVQDLWSKVYKEHAKPQGESKGKELYDPEAIKLAYEAITNEYDKYTLRSYLTDVANWSPDAINLYDLGNAHVVFENGFIESFKDAFLSSNAGGKDSGMTQLQDGMDAVPKAFLRPNPEKGLQDSLLKNITFGARVKRIGLAISENNPNNKGVVKVYYDTQSGTEVVVDSDYLILAIPYTSQRSIVKDFPFNPYQEMAIRDVRYVEVTKVLLQYKKRWWKDVFGDNKQGTDGGVVSDLPIRYTMFPKEAENDQFKDHNERGAVMAAYTFEQDATILGALSPERRIELAARNLDKIFPEAQSLDLLEAGTSQVFPADELAGGSAFCYFGPKQKSQYMKIMMETDWDGRVLFAGEQASYTHGWIQGALEAALRCVGQLVGPEKSQNADTTKDATSNVSA